MTNDIKNISPIVKKLPSELVKEMVAVIERLANDDAYVIDMHAWHEPKEGKCHIGLGGAYLADNGLKPAFDNTHKSVKEDAWNISRALNFANMGRLQSALRCLYGYDGPPDGFDAIADVQPTVMTFVDPESWKSSMEIIITRLEENGF